ncbi:hypothetical protein BDP55DRAFT_769595 [Colletotrichum godetiae]|uniref:Uncharacterized protein n=1 Tax=Colletotrichum godetiae TaxID=1209918 RepID=A0AAJ0EUA7_9PEZI|nr:uncharacterized protein BDP55DRAFT_769595 [Colletotrichum godetiae]KAK1674153.1 hypothetical protein BDP55DRAFT_769595 [Colletotrichum godetiae]
MVTNSGKDPETTKKYAWISPTHPLPDFQREWLDLAAKLFNTDTLDILVTSEEKKEILALIALSITASSFGNQCRAQALHRTVYHAREMGQGKRPSARVAIISALLIYKLEPPPSWLEWDTMRQPLSVLRYVRDCADGFKVYSSEGMLKAALALQSAVPAQDSSDSFFVINNKPASKETSTKSSEVSQLTSDHPSLPALRPWTRSITKFITPSPPSKKRKAESNSSQEKKAAQQKEMANTKKIKLVVPKKKSPEVGAKTSIRAAISTSKFPPTWQTQDAEAAKRQQPIDNVLLVRYMKNAPMLDRIADYNDQSVRRVALASFIEDLKSSGWDDLEKCTLQLIKDGEFESRTFLAETIMNDVYQRINDSVEDVPQLARPIQPKEPTEPTQQLMERPMEAKQLAHSSLEADPTDTPTKKRSRPRSQMAKQSAQTKQPKNTLSLHISPTKQRSQPFRFSPSSRMSDDVFNENSPILDAPPPASVLQHPNLASPPRFNIREILSKRLKSKDA